MLRQERLGTYVFETVEVLVSLAACFAIEWLLLLHAESPRIWRTGFGINDGECAVAVLVQLLRLVTVGFVISGGLG